MAVLATAATAGAAEPAWHRATSRHFIVYSAGDVAALDRFARRLERFDTVIRARTGLVRANRADPDDPLPLVAYHRSFAAAGREPPAAASAGLARAVELVPQDDELRVTWAEDHARRGDLAAALAAIRPVAVRPHMTDTVKKAIALVAAWQKRMPPAAAQAAVSSASSP